MTAKWICDGCGREQPGEPSRRGWLKPMHWYQRSDDDGVQDACSRRCINDISDASGKTGVVLPI